MNALATPDWRPLHNTLARNHGFEPLRVDGTVPADLVGTLYRNGPGAIEVLGSRVGHPFEADGAISAVRFDGQSATGAARIVSTAHAQREAAAGRRLYTSAAGWLDRIWNQYTSPPGNPLNTSVMVHQGQLLALCEAGAPAVIDPDTLTAGPEVDLGIVQQAFSAHPHRVNARRASYNFGMRYGQQTFIDLYELPDQGANRLLGSIELDRAVMLHDFIATERHLVFFVGPAFIRIWRALLAVGDMSTLVSWEPSAGTEILVVPIDRPSEVTRFHTDAFWCWHTATAQDREDGTIAIDYVRYDGLDSLVELGERGAQTPVIEDAPGGTLHRAILDAKAEQLRTEAVTELPVEFPRIHPRLEGGEARYLYMVWGETERGIARVDMSDASVQRWTPPQHQACSEPVPVPRGHTGDESDVWLVTLLYDARTQTSGVAVLDGQRVDDGPVCTAWFEQAIPETYHGIWVG